MISSFSDHSFRLSLVYLPPNDDDNILKVRDAKVLSLSVLYRSKLVFFSKRFQILRHHVGFTNLLPSSPHLTKERARFVLTFP